MAASLHTLKQRALIIQAIRRFFVSNGFLEVETPSLVPSPGMEPHLNAFKTVYYPEFSSLCRPQQLYLPTSPEFHMKRMLAKGCRKIFQVCRAFRNGEQSNMHQPEFTILEWYRTNAGYFDIMKDVENLFISIITNGMGVSSIGHSLHNIDYSPPWPKLTVSDAWQTYTGINLERNYTADKLRKEGIKLGVNNLHSDDSRESVYFKIFLDRIEPYLGKDRPVFLYDYPADMAALARLKPENPSVAMRFELYIAGMELGNAFDEVVDPRVQISRCENARALQKSLGKEPFPIDEEFIKALEKGIPPSAGIAMGVDRMLMLLLNRKTIQDVTAFPFNTPATES
jgi:elongation factor P--(R)-beta-lysine ligase